LQRYLDGLGEVRFQYGQLDCCLFTCDAVMAMTGHDMAAWYRGRYRTRKEALTLIRERTGRASVKAVAMHAAQECGLEAVPVALARRGDMALIGTGSNACMGIVSLSGLDVMAVYGRQIVRVALRSATMAWRI
jgi:hypothetical protein